MVLNFLAGKGFLLAGFEYVLSFEHLLQLLLTVYIVGECDNPFSHLVSFRLYVLINHC